jgi:hypothetical protein
VILLPFIFAVTLAENGTVEDSREGNKADNNQSARNCQKQMKLLEGSCDIDVPLLCADAQLAKGELCIICVNPVVNLIFSPFKRLDFNFRIVYNLRFTSCRREKSSFKV